MVQTTYTKLRANLAKYMDRATEDSEIIFISRKKSTDVAMLAATELESLLETAHLLSSPVNRKRLLEAYVRAEERTEEPMTLDDLRAEVGLTPKAAEVKSA